jgi:hypothetical protein
MLEFRMTTIFPAIIRRSTCVHLSKSYSNLMRIIDCGGQPSNHRTLLISTITMQNPALLASFSMLLVFLAYRRCRNRRSLPLPPGPSAPIPWIRNFFQLPTEQQYLTFQEWSQKYGAIFVTRTHSILIYHAGDVFSVEAFGSRYIVVNSREACIDLFEKKGSNISDRPDVPMLTDLSV